MAAKNSFLNRKQKQAYLSKGVKRENRANIFCYVLITMINVKSQLIQKICWCIAETIDLFESANNFLLHN